MFMMHHRGLAIIVGIALVFGLLWAMNHRKAGDIEIPTGPVTGLMLAAEARAPVGEVTRIRAGEVVAVTDGMLLAEGDVVRTAAQGSVTLEFFAGSRVALDTGTEVTIVEASVDPENQRAQRVAIQLHAGRIWNRVLKLLEVESDFHVQGATLTATVRGTAFAVTSHPGVAGSDESVDLFDGHLHIATEDGRSEGILEAGFTFTQGVGAGDLLFAAHVVPTPDSVRNDGFIRAQLREDAAFIERVRGSREQLGDVTSYLGVGEEAGLFTLDHEGVEHSAYQSLEVRMDAPLTALAPGNAFSLRAIAHFYEDGSLVERDVTREALWQLSDPALATLTGNGVITAKEGSGVVTATARWNDGTHEHSDSFTIPIGGTLIEIAPPVLTL